MHCPFQEGEFPAPVLYVYAVVGVIEDGPENAIGRRVFCVHPHQGRFIPGRMPSLPFPTMPPSVEGMEHEVPAGVSVPLPALSFEFVPASPHAVLASVARLEDLGRYGYDLALGEGFELVYDRWVDAAELRAWLASRHPAGPAGDIYAVRLDEDGTPGR